MANSHSAKPTSREKFIMALEGKQPPGRVPHFELVFYLTMEAFGKVHPTHRIFSQWDQMSKIEQNLQIHDMADLYVQTMRKYEHSAAHVLWPVARKAGADFSTKATRICNPFDIDDQIHLLEDIRNISGMQYCLLVPGDATYGIPDGSEMMDFVGEIADHPDKLKAKADQMVDEALETAEKLRKEGLLDGFTMCSDYCFNTAPFFSPAMFDEFITPYLTRLIAGYRQMGFYTIKHTDGNIMPILDSLISAKPHALHSLDPQAGVDIAEIKRLVGQKVCLIGNVNCALLDTGTDEEVIDFTKYALKHGMPGGGYIFSTSNCIYTGMSLRRYELILDVWRKYGNYD